VINMTQVRTLAQAQEEIKHRCPFRMSDTLHATEGWNGARGHLPWPDYRDSIKDAPYVVISYGTPIAWITQDGREVIPDVGYSATTGQHQMTVQAAWGWVVRYPARGRPLRPAGGGPRRGGIDGPA
jgi:hypothetical protein